MAHYRCIKTTASQRRSFLAQSFNSAVDKTRCFKQDAHLFGCVLNSIFLKKPFVLNYEIFFFSSSSLAKYYNLLSNCTFSQQSSLLVVKSFKYSNHTAEKIYNFPLISTHTPPFWLCGTHAPKHAWFNALEARVRISFAWWVLTYKKPVRTCCTS